MRKVLIIFIIVCNCGFLKSQESTSSDSVKTEKKNIIKRVIDYFENSNEVNNDKRFDFSIIGGPHYSSDTKFGLGLVASGLYRLDRNDLSMSPSNVSLYGDITTTGAYVIGISGNTLFPQLKYRIDADMYFSYNPSRYWGVGYTAGRRDHYSKFDNVTSEIKIDFLKRIGQSGYVGLTGNFRNIRGQAFEDISLLNGARDKSTAVGGGYILSYDSRDFIPNPYSGIYLKLEQIFYPKFMGSTYEFNKIEFIFRYYKEVWKGGVMAYDLQAIFNNGDTSWNMMSGMGNSHQMRGYYAGRYRDKKLVQTQVELRQHVYKRSGVALWAGAGNIFPKFSAFDWSETLPTFGIGYRWEFKNRVNVRLDYGIGKGESAFYFNINEAF